MPRRPIAKKAPAKPKRKAQKAPAVTPYQTFYASQRERLKALEDKVVEQAEYITKQERMIARLLSLLNDKGP